MSPEERLEVRSKVGNESFEGVDNWDASEQKNENCEEDELPKAAVGGKVSRAELVP